MIKHNRIIRANKEYVDLRKMHKDQLNNALKGMNIHEVDIDGLYVKKLKNINILEEFFGKQKR